MCLNIPHFLVEPVYPTQKVRHYDQAKVQVSPRAYALLCYSLSLEDGVLASFPDSPHVQKKHTQKNRVGRALE